MRRCSTGVSSLAFVWKRGWNDAGDDEERCGWHAQATSKRFLESIRKEDSYVGRSDVEKQGCCPVCDEKLRHDESILRLPCAHVFHHDCLMPWLGLPPHPPTPSTPSSLLSAGLACLSK